MQKDHRTDLALRRYDAILRYLGAESATYWSRSQLFMIANATLLGLVTGAIAKEKDVMSATRAIFLVAAGSGLFLSVLWLQGLKAGSDRIEHWVDRLKELEPQAFDTLKLFRELPSGRARRVAKRAAWLFTSLWGMLLLYLGWLPARR
jgi:hypothetical protein